MLAHGWITDKGKFVPTKRGESHFKCFLRIIEVDAKSKALLVKKIPGWQRIRKLDHSWEAVVAVVEKWGWIRVVDPLWFLVWNLKDKRVEHYLVDERREIISSGEDQLIRVETPKGKCIDFDWKDFVDSNFHIPSRLGVKTESLAEQVIKVSA